MDALHDGDGNGNGGERQPDEQSVHGLPAEWGVVIIPADASALADEAGEARLRVRRAARQRRWRRRLRLPAAPATSPAPNNRSLRVPLIVISTFVIVMTATLFAIGPPAHHDQPGRASGSAAPSSTTLAAMTLPDALGAPTRLADLAPAVYLLVRDCACVDLVRSTLAVAPADVWVVEIASTAQAAFQAATVLATPRPPAAVPSGPGGLPTVAGSAATTPGATAVSPGASAATSTGAARVRVLVDSRGAVAEAVPAVARTGADAAAILVDRRHEIVKALPTVRSTAEIIADLKHLTR